jgi:sec-independent protein translocase protein TatC
LLYFVAEFVLPALSRQEKRYLLPGIAIGFVLFAAGVVLCFKLILPQTLAFFYDYGANLQFDNRWQAREYFSFVTHLCLAFGLLCELPVGIIALAALGLISYSWLSHTRAYAVVVILILSAVIAPTPDPVTFISMGAPIIILYEICIWLVWLMERRKRAREASAKDYPD